VNDGYLFIQQKMAQSYEPSRFSFTKIECRQRKLGSHHSWHDIFPVKWGVFSGLLKAKEKHEQAFLIGSRMLGTGQSRPLLPFFSLAPRCSIW
jgi:hypothetical protein